MALFSSGRPEMQANGHGGQSRQAQGITVKSAVRYAFLPGIFPRLRNIGKSFGHFAYVLALIFRSARLLPSGHPMLVSANIGRFGFLDVISAAANNLVLSRKNIDQIMIFGAIVVAVLMIIIQMVLIGVYAMMAPGAANAADGMFSTPNPDEDVVFGFLQQVIGVDGFYNNSQAVGISVAGALHQMLGFYSTAMMIIATIIVIYYVIVVVGESAQTGTPFGRRFNGLWAPVRLVLALGLLVPLGNGLNAAQYVALTVAKLGSGLATQAWSTFNTGFLSEKNAEKLIAPVFAEGMSEIIKTVFLYEVCAEAYNLQQPQGSGNSVQPVLFLPDEKLTGALPFKDLDGFLVAQTNAYFVKTKNYQMEWTTYKPGDKIRSNKFSCGTITLNYAADGADDNAKLIADGAANAYAQALIMARNELHPIAKRYAARAVPAQGSPEYTSVEALAEAGEIRKIITKVDDYLYSDFSSRFPDYAKNTLEKELGDDYQKGGWGNAASFYMKLAFANQKISTIVRNAAPAPASAEPNFAERAVTFMSGNALGDEGEYIQIAMENADKSIVRAIPTSTVPFLSDNIAKMRSPLWEDANPVASLMTLILGGDAFVDMIDPNPQIQAISPMARLSRLGDSLYNKALIAFGLVVGSKASPLIVGAGASLGGPYGALLAYGVMKGIEKLLPLIILFGGLGLGVGFILFYVVPFMPFVYFFFAIVEWVMGVLEAMVGTPLWALAHLRIEGDGMPGGAAMGGYNIFFSMLIRPFLILFGLIASYIMFTAGAQFLNHIYGAMIMAGTDGERAPSFVGMGYIGYMILYVVIIYNLGLVSFKMIDQIPAQSLRWLGVGDQSYKDGKPDPIGNISTVATATGGLLGMQLMNTIKGQPNPNKPEGLQPSSEVTEGTQRLADRAKKAATYFGKKA